MTDRQLHPGDNLHVWHANLDRHCHTTSTLTDDETKRADRFHFERDRNRFIAARATLRNVLSRYVDANESDIRFECNQFGKPALADETSHDIRFNVTHSSHLMLIAITHGRDVGIDVERIDDDRSDPEIARRFFSPNEYTTLMNLPAEQQTEAFFDCWTRKEAFVKAHGLGLSMPLDQFDVSFGAGTAPAILRSNFRGRDDTQDHQHWSMIAFVPEESFRAAVVIDATAPPAVEHFSYEPMPLPTTCRRRTRPR